MKLIDNLTVLQCLHFTDKSPTMRTRGVKDYEFDLYIDGDREMYTDGTHYHITKGALVFRQPGEKVSSVGDYNAYIMTLDFSGSPKITPEKYARSNFTPMQQKADTNLFEDIPKIFYPKHFQELKDLYKKIMSCTYPDITDRNLQKKYFREFLFLILYDTNLNARDEPLPTYTEKACSFINAHYKEQISLEDIAKHVMINKNYLIRLFKKELNTTPNNYMTETRLYHSQLLLLQSDYTVKNIALSCGFNTPSYFIKLFRNKYGDTPEDYRKKRRGM